MAEQARKFMIVAGEASGDRHAARVVEELRELFPEAEFFGAAGPRMRAAGVRGVVRSDDLSIVGLIEIAKALPIFLRARKDLLAAARTEKPDVAILVDFPDFNLKLAKSLKKHGIPVVYYVSPQIWAWRAYRIRSIRHYVDLLLAILPFEKGWYAERGIQHVEYVGNPLAREVHATEEKPEFSDRYGLDPERPIVALLPGSRHKEIVRILPELLRTAARMLQKNSDIQFVIALAFERHRSEIDAAMARLDESERRLLQDVRSVFGETYNALNAADTAAVTSGTATLETGIIGTPMAIVYKSSAINYKLLRPLIRVEHFGLINLIAERRLAAELIQDDFTPESLAAELFRLLSPEVNGNVRKELKAAAEKLGHGGAAKRAAAAIQKLLNK
ncbi:MAG TPA: lipid-A-disaccharide synthase [Pyrinomonadaceae bacterium]|nr:lipid-A-disaccharide synthase [Pyrinomonadaceae bacterium]